MGGSFGGASGGMFGGGGARSGDRPFVTSVVPVVDDPFADATAKVKLDQGVQAAATGGDVGELFRYVIKTPVTLPRSESAMLPIVNAPVKGEKVAIYNPSVHAKHPLSGLKLTNSTDLHLLQGPVTLFDGGEYAGDARIEDLAPGSTRLISYALDLETEVALQTKPEQKVITKLQIRKGGLLVSHKFTRQSVYTVKNSSDKPKSVLVERPLQPEWKPTTPEPEETSRAQHRYRLAAAPGKPATLTVNEEREAIGEMVLANLDSDELRIYARLPVSTPKLTVAFEQLLSAKSKAVEASAAVDAKELQTISLAQEQDRVRRNLQAIPALRANDNISEENKKAGNELLNKYLKRLGELDTEQEKVRVEKFRLEEERQKAKSALDKLLAELVAE